MGEPNYQLTKDFKHRINKLILSAFPNQLWCIDLIDWSQLYKRHRGNQGYRYIVNVVDVFSRKIWIEKMKNKEAEIMQKKTKVEFRPELSSRLDW